jgi:hypothetical protein
MKALGLGLGGMLVLGLLGGCGTEDLSIGSDESALLAKDTSLGSAAILVRPTYYAMRPDLRLCPSPMCGGVWVRALNRSWTRCADGTYAEECYAASDDWSALGLSPEETQRVRGRVLSGHGIVQGSLEGSLPSPAGESAEIAQRLWGKLRVTEAWLAATEREPAGIFYRVHELPIDCMPGPSCLPIEERKLNFREVYRVLRVNFQLTGATRRQIQQAMEEMARGNLIVAGKNRPVFFPTTTAVDPATSRPVEELVATQFYFRVPKPEVTCTELRCEAGTYCYDGDGQARCIPYATCANTPMLCKVGEHCEDVPIVCVVAPCPPTAPTCMPVCPPDGTIDCMPIVPPERLPLCSGPYHEWILRNCPGVKFTY